MAAVAVVVAVVAWPTVVSSDAASTAHASQMWASGPARIFWVGPGTWPQNEHAGTCSDLVPTAPSSSASWPPGAPGTRPGTRGTPLQPGAVVLHPDVLRGRVTSSPPAIRR